MSEMTNQDRVNAALDATTLTRADHVAARWLKGDVQPVTLAMSPSPNFSARLMDEANRVKDAVERLGIGAEVTQETEGLPGAPLFVLLLVPRHRRSADSVASNASDPPNAWDLQRDKERLALRQAAAFIKQRVAGDVSRCVMLRSTDPSPKWPEAELDFARDVVREMTLMGHPVQPSTDWVEQDDEWVLCLAPVAPTVSP